MADIFEEADEFIRRPFAVKSIHVTLENIHEISEVVGTLVQPEDESLLPYIDVNPEVIRNRKKLRIGQWITRKDGEYQIFGADSFDNQFYPATPEIMGWVEWLGRQRDEG